MGVGVGVGMGMGGRSGSRRTAFLAWEECARGARGRAPNKGFARRPQRLPGWEECEWKWEWEWEWGVGVVVARGAAPCRRIKVSQGARKDSWRGCM